MSAYDVRISDWSSDVFSSDLRDRGVTRDLLMRAKAAGYAGLVLAIDVPVPANRERDRRTGMTIPPRFSLRSMLAFARHPLWCWNILVRRPVKLANFAGQRAEPGSTLLNFIHSQLEPKLSCVGMSTEARRRGKECVSTG